MRATGRPIRLFLALCAAVVLVSAVLSSPVAGVEATYYTEAENGPETSTGVPFTDEGMTAAGPAHLAGQTVNVCHGGACVDVVVTDHCPCGHLDLSPAAFEALAPLDAGRINVTVGGGSGAVRPTPSPGEEDRAPPATPRQARSVGLTG